VLKTWALPILILYVLVLTFASLAHVNAVPKLGFAFDDKIYHFLAYAVLTWLSFNYLITTTVNYKILISGSLAIVYGIIIEGLQATLTDFRTPDYFDVLANTAGVLFVILVLKFNEKLKLK
jgi:VanZ family protein